MSAGLNPKHVILLQKQTVKCHKLNPTLSLSSLSLTERWWSIWGEYEWHLEDEMVGWHHQLNESEQARGAGDGQGGLACCSPWGRKESDMTERLKNNKR